ncbi:peptidase inhibitor family I36 protein [Streptomyces sp. NPDC055025]
MRKIMLMLSTLLGVMLITPSAVAGAAPPPRLGACATGELCLWERTDFQGARQTRELSGTETGSCVPLARGTTAESLANRTGRNVTTYQSAECEETGEFETYPGKGTWVPGSPHRVRAFKLWER